MKISEIYRNERTQKLLGLLSLYLVYVLFFKSVSFSSLWGKFFIDKYDLKSYLMYEISKRLITLIISVFIICVLFKNKLDLDDSKKMNLIKSILIAITVFLLYYSFIARITIYLQGYLFNSFESPATNIITKLINQVPAYIICVGILAPIMEELAFRKGLFGFLYELYSGCNEYIRIISSVLISSIVFGAIHNGYFHPSMIYYSVFGIVCSLLYLYTKRISSPIIIHMMLNLTWAIFTIFG